MIYNALPLLLLKVKVKIIRIGKSFVQHFVIFNRSFITTALQRYVFFLTVVYFSITNLLNIPL